MDILSYIPTGRENAVTRKELCIRTGLTDREIRQKIEKARKDGNIIINLQDGKGYYQPEGTEEIQKQYTQNQKRAMSILIQQKYLRRKLKEAGAL